MARFAYLIQHAFRTMSYMPIAFITAKTGKNVKAVLNLAQSLYKQAQRRVGTGTLNRVLREAVDAHPPASRENRTPRIYYATQVDVAPPTIVLFVNSTRLFDATYQRYLLNVFRQKLPFRDVPIKLYLRSQAGRAGEPPPRQVRAWRGRPRSHGRGLRVCRAVRPVPRYRGALGSLRAIPPSRGQRAPGRARRLTGSRRVDPRRSMVPWPSMMDLASIGMPIAAVS